MKFTKGPSDFEGLAVGVGKSRKQIDPVLGLAFKFVVSVVVARRHYSLYFVRRVA